MPCNSQLCWWRYCYLRGYSSIPSWKFSSCLKRWWKFSHWYKREPYQFPSQVPQTWNVDWAALSAGFTPGARGFQRAVNGPVALPGRGFSCQLLHHNFPRWWGHLRIMPVVGFLPTFVGGVCVCWVVGEGWWMRGGAVSSCSSSLPSVPVLYLSWISPVYDFTTRVLRPQIAWWFSVRLLSRLVVHPWGWLGSLSTLAAPQIGRQLYAPKQSGVTHLKIDVPSPTAVRWAGLILGRKAGLFLAPVALPAPLRPAWATAVVRFVPQARRDPRLYVSFLRLKRLSFVFLCVLVCLRSFQVQIRSLWRVQWIRFCFFFFQLQFKCIL